MELKSSHNELAVNILKQIEKAIEKIQERTKDINNLKNIPFCAKFGGATGNMNAHKVAYPHLEWKN